MREDILKALAADEDEEQKLEQISNVINLYGGKRDSLIQILHLAQEIYGYLPLGVQKFISEEMDIPVAEVSGVVTFYSFFGIGRLMNDQHILGSDLRIAIRNHQRFIPQNHHDQKRRRQL